MAEPPNSLLHRRTILAIFVLAAVTGGLMVGRAATLSSECAQGDWPTFVMTFAATEHGEPIGLIEWCGQGDWAIRSLADADDQAITERAASATDSVLFSWFAESLAPEEAWTRADQRTPTVDQPRHPEAAVAFSAETNLGSLRMEFSADGIPLVHQRSGGEDQLWSVRLDRVDRPLRADDEIFGRPLCSEPLPPGQRRRTTTCWNELGRLIDRSGCLNRFDSLIDTFSDPACVL